MFVCDWNYGLWPDPVFTPTNIPSLRDGPPNVERFSTNIPSLRDDSLALRLCYKRSVPLGRFPTFYDCATNVPSRWDGFLRSMIVLHIWSRWDRLVRRTAYCLKLKFGGHPYEV